MVQWSTTASDKLESLEIPREIKARIVQVIEARLQRANVEMDSAIVLDVVEGEWQGTVAAKYIWDEGDCIVSDLFVNLIRP